MILTKQYVQNYIKTNKIDTSKPFALDLSNKGFTSIEAGAFNELVKLKYLYLHNNKLSNVDNVFNELVNLGALSLYNNNLTSVDNVFNGLVSLEALDLHNNQLTSIEVGAFNGLVNLETLSLSSNNLTSVDISNNEELNFFSVDTKTKVYINKDQISLMEKCDITNYEVVGKIGSKFKNKLPELENQISDLLNQYQEITKKKLDLALELKKQMKIFFSLDN